MYNLFEIDTLQFSIKEKDTMKGKKKRVLPGFGLSLGFTSLYLSLFVLIPLSMVFIQTSQLGWGEFFEIVTSERVFIRTKLVLVQHSLQQR